ncbi:hypothetical protein [Chitinophaga sp. SYP-B3965]|uniref:hypothetical protein n=1 Tax=Chitinophaga sp. SYP-B3965 TaxID=2663120 RepID=UPI0015638521|nr:hypothetical protein [Chitinophaga sp. SYP-B3965]
MNSNSIKIKINHDRLQELWQQYELLTDSYEPDNAHEQLLFECVVLMRDKIEKVLRTTQLKYTLTFSSLEALGFFQVWNMVDTSHHVYADIIIRNIIQVIHRASIDPKRAKFYNKLTYGKKRNKESN